MSQTLLSFRTNHIMINIENRIQGHDGPVGVVWSSQTAEGSLNETRYG